MGPNAMSASTKITSSVVVSVLKELYERPPWLPPSDTIEWTSWVESDHDGIVVRGMIVSRSNAWLDGNCAEGHIDGRLLRMVDYTGNKGAFLDVLDREQQSVLMALEEYATADLGLLPLASEALQDDGACEVLIDALLEAGAITAHSAPAYLSEAQRPDWVRKSLRRTALVYARHILAPRIFGTWSTTRWPVTSWRPAGPRSRFG